MAHPGLRPEIRADIDRTARMAFSTKNVLAENTWDAINVAGAPEGELTDGCGIYDWDTSTMYTVPDLPASIDLEHLVDGEGEGQNTGNTTQDFTLTVELIDPDGNVRATDTDTETKVPGEYITAVTPQATLDKSGTWELHVKLEA